MFFTGRRNDRRSKRWQVLDLCSGAGGPWIWLRPILAERGLGVSVCLTDKYPNLDALGRADCENVLKELPAGFALPTLCLENFWASAAALSLATLACNLMALFHRHLGRQHKVSLRNLRFWLFVTAGVRSHPAGKTTIKLAVPRRERDWWRCLWEKISSPLPNCNAVENQPAFTG